MLFLRTRFVLLYTILDSVILSEGPPMNLSISMHLRGFHHVFGGNHTTAVKFETVAGGPWLRSG